MQGQLTKPEKKLARELIEKGLQREFERAIADMGAIITDWKNKKLDNRSAYQALYDTMHLHDKHIARRYDYMSAARYLMTVGALLAEGLIAKEDIAGFLDENRTHLNNYLKI